VDWTELAARAASGDDRAVAELVRSVQGDIWRYCAAFVGHADAEDVAQAGWPASAGSRSSPVWSA
jgi:DNA-directed RNA polymerase specialized sigma24 family protein